MGTVKATDGVSLHVESHGEGTPILFSCGLNTTHENFRPQVAPFVAAGHRVLLWDYRGHGKSESPDDAAAYSIDHVVDDIARVLDEHAGGQPAVLAGLSFGGLASLHFALRHPERVRALVLIDTGPGFKNPKAQAGWEAQLEKTAQFLESRGMEGFVASKAMQIAIGNKPELPAAEAAKRAIAAQDPVGLCHFGRNIAGPAPPVIDELASIDLPALVIVGEKDEPYLRASEVMATRMPRAEKVTIPGAGHIVNIEASDAFDTAVLKFLEGLSD